MSIMKRKLFTDVITFIATAVVLLVIPSDLSAQGKMLRDRGESYHTLVGSNTSGFGDVWVSGRLVGHVWDDEPTSLDRIEGAKQRWVSNIRGFPEAGVNIGLFSNIMFTMDSRILGWGWKPGWLSGALKWTPLDNKELRLHGAALSLKYIHFFSEGPPTIGGYRGFMPEGFVVKGGAVEGWVLYEMDLLARFSSVPLRFITNVGFRTPLERSSCGQTLFNGGVVVNGYEYDFFLYYSIEAFNNLFEPKAFFTDAEIDPVSGETLRFKKHLVYFSENPSYLTMGGNFRYENGIVVTVAVPLLLSVNQQSRISRHDQVELDRGNSALFPDEVKRGIKDPFDPWFVKWKVYGSVTFPIRYRSTSTEMLRNYLLLKNRKEERTIDFDQRLNTIENEKIEKQIVDQEKDDQQRLEEIRRRREQILTEEGK